MRVVFFILGIILTVHIQAQNNRQETENSLYWQEGTKLKYSDFANAQVSDELPGEAKLIYNIRIPVVLEYHKVIENKETMKVNWYIVPAFDKVFSIFTKPNEEDMELAQIYFDITEYWTRITRERILSLQQHNLDRNFDIDNFYKKELGIKASAAVKRKFEEELAKENGDAFLKVFEDIVEIMYMQREQMGMDLYFDVNIENKSDVIINRRRKIDDLLAQTKRYATSKTDCERFIRNKPFDENYTVVYEEKER
ncbi:MAG: hypothetical protein LBL90_07680 [Prevotellaceae bacterium]|jgi:hypothetical protein|nr:hypothetical protein [Prevotellaceae bacterium]